MKVKGNKKTGYKKGYIEYLQPSEYCESDNPKIIKKAKEIVKKIKGKKTDLKKANAILNYVQKNVKYKLYGGTHKGALGLFESKKDKKSGKITANCADQSHLTVALLRAANIPAQYRINGFNDTDGKMKYHAWVYALIPNKKGKLTWQSGDPTIRTPWNFGLKTGDKWESKKLLPNYGHNTENNNIYVTTKQISKTKYIDVMSQTVTVNGKKKQTLFADYPDKIKKK